MDINVGDVFYTDGGETIVITSLKIDSNEDPLPDGQIGFMKYSKNIPDKNYQVGQVKRRLQIQYLREKLGSVDLENYSYKQMPSPQDKVSKYRGGYPENVSGDKLH